MKTDWSLFPLPGRQGPGVCLRHKSGMERFAEKIPMKSIFVLLAAGAMLGGLVLADHSVRAEAQKEQSSASQTVAAQMAARSDARIARLKARLGLTADQEKNWGGLESALRDIAKKRADRRIAERDERAKQTAPMSFPDRLKRRADELSNRSADLKTAADAVQPIYASLDDRQKERLDRGIGRLVDR